MKKRFPIHPFLPLARRQTLGVGIAALVFGIGFLVFGGVLASYAHTWGSDDRVPVILMLAIIVIVGVGFLDAAYALLRGRRKELLGSFSLYAIGGFLCAIPILLLVAIYKGVAKSGNIEQTMLTLPAIAIGLMAIRLAWLRSRNRKHRIQPIETTRTVPK